MFLAALAPPDAWKDDAASAGWIPLIYYQQLRWAKPCMPFGSFTPPTLTWLKRNYSKYKVWVSTEDSPTDAGSHNSLIWMGFMPIGGDNTPEPKLRTSPLYPRVSVIEIGCWRLILDEKNKKLELQQAESTTEQTNITLDPTTQGLNIRQDDLNNLKINKDGTIELTASESIDLTLPGASLTISKDGTVTIHASTKIQFGDGSDALTLDQKLRTYLASAFVNTGVGPSSPLTPPANPLTFGSQLVKSQ